LLKVCTYVEGPTNCNPATSTTREGRKLVVKVKVYTYVEGPTNCNAATSTTR